MHRRGFVQSIAGGAIAFIPGCSEGLKDNPTTSSDTESPDTTKTETLSASQSEERAANVVVEYSMTVAVHQEVPDRVIEHPNPQEFRWVVVEFEVVNGLLDANDILGLTQVLNAETHHFTRAVVIETPEEVFLSSPNKSYMMRAGARGKAYYRFSGEVSGMKWVVSQLKNQYGLEIRELPSNTES